MGMERVEPVLKVSGDGPHLSYNSSKGRLTISVLVVSHLQGQAHQWNQISIQIEF